MRTPPTVPVHRPALAGAAPRSLLLGALLLAVTAGCGAVEERLPPPTPLGSSVQRLEEDNGLAFNGLATNGLATNGLATNGLATNGLASSSFSSWFQQDPRLSALFMKYLVRCAVPAGETRTYSDGGTSWDWSGHLGLAPGWASGSPATVAEQQVVTACLAALANKFERSITVSVLGATAQGKPIPHTASELADFSQREACYFGDLFGGGAEGDGAEEKDREGTSTLKLFVGNDQALFHSSTSSLRVCALASTNSSSRSECPPLVHIGECKRSCELDPTGTYYTRCTHNGITYLPLTTRIRTQDIVTCGDGLCQPSEVCGSSNHFNNCGVDCGPCP